MEPFFIPEEVKENYRYALNEARKDRPRYLNWIKEEIEILLNLINRFDKIAVLGGIATRHIKSIPTFYNQFLENYQGEDQDKIDESEKLQPDDNIEVLLEYLMNIVTAAPGNNNTTLPTHENLNEIYEQLLKIKFNINFWEMSAELPASGEDADHWLRTMIVQDTLNVRGQGYFGHVKEMYQEVFNPHNDFLYRYYGFTATNLFDTVLKWDSLVYSKIGTPYGFLHAQKRMEEWGKANNHPEGFFVLPFHIREFGRDNPDLHDPENPNFMTSYSLDNISNYEKIFWIIPHTEIEKKIFLKLSLQPGENSIFFDSKFKAFPQGDSLLRLQPLVRIDDKYFHFSMDLPFRNIFTITEELIKSADVVYYENYFRGNAQYSTKDNCVERKTKAIFESLLPGVDFYQSLHYTTTEAHVVKDNELDILGVSTDTLYIIEVKAGELNTKSKRGAIKGIKDKLKETLGKGSYQCHRAATFIDAESPAIFRYASGGTSHSLVIDKNQYKSIYKIAVTLEQLSVVSMELSHLIKAGIMSEEYKGVWLVSIYDLMVFRDIIETEEDFKEYLDYRMQLYDREDIAFMDEIDVLGYYLDGQFPLGPVIENTIITMTGYNQDIEDYYTRKSTGFPGTVKPRKK